MSSTAKAIDHLNDALGEAAIAAFALHCVDGDTDDYDMVTDAIGAISRVAWGVALARNLLKEQAEAALVRAPAPKPAEVTT
jgi:hypothetical protein